MTELTDQTQSRRVRYPVAEALGKCMWAAALVAASFAHAQTLEPYVVLHIGAGATMRLDACAASDAESSVECPGSDVACAVCNAPGCDDLVANDSRLFKAKQAASGLVSAFGEVSFALTRFSQDPAPFSCPNGGWTGAAAGCDGDAAGSGSNTADLLVDFMEGGEGELLSWLDGCDNWPTETDCDPVVDLAPDTGCTLCPECAGGCDKEIRGDGDAPIAGSLVGIRQWLESAVMPADPVAACRSYGVVLFSDGQNTCAGDAATEAAALCDAGVPVLVVGYDEPALLPDLQAAASAGCGPACATGPTGEARCDGQVLFADDQDGLSLAFTAMAQQSVVTERCNGVDDDCDGLTDEGFPDLGQECCDPCPGTIACTPDGTGTACDNPGPCPELPCNCTDDDCDGQTDEGIACVIEVCNGIDDDGDGLTDEAEGPCWFLAMGVPCGSGVGECKMGVTCCMPEGYVGCCRGVSPEPEICDCRDNDCNGFTDEGVVRRCFTGPAQACPDPESGSCPGRCRPGGHYCDTKACPVRPGIGPCLGEVLPGVEVCNEIDDDCDGETDEGVTPLGCNCEHGCNPCHQFGCPEGFICDGVCGETECAPCIPDPCMDIECGVGLACDPRTGECVDACLLADCGDEPCCLGVCGQECAGEPAVDAGRPVVQTFRVGGGGGCTCQTSPSAPLGWWLLVWVALLGTMRRRRWSGSNSRAVGPQHRIPTHPQSNDGGVVVRSVFQ